MTRTPKFKASISALLLTGVLAISLPSCKAPSPTQTPSDAATQNAPQNTVEAKLPPIRTALSCLPDSAAIIAAHRGTDERWRDTAENSIGGLKALIDHGTLMAEIDVAGLTDQVLLIAYSSGQAEQLARLAPEMLRSNPKDAAKKGHAVWLGYDVANGQTAARLKDTGHYTIGRIGDPNRQPPLRALQTAADILVTDQAERYEGVIGLKGRAKADYEACLAG